MTANHQHQPDDRNDEGWSDEAVARLLGTTADALLEAVTDSGRGVLVHLAETGGDINIGTLDLDGRHPAEVLVGTVAPEHWLAMGVATGGRAYSLDDPGRGRGGTSRRIVSVVLVHRRGSVVSRLLLDGEVSSSAPAYGVVLDCLQRALWLDTAAPAVPTGGLFATYWLESALHLVAEQGGQVSWPEVCSQHPAARLLDDDYRIASTGELVAAAAALQRVCDWERLRWLVIEGSWEERTLTPTEAAWFDAGSFSRWVLTEHPPPDVLVGEIRHLAPPRIARQCFTALRRMGIPTRGAGTHAA